MKRLIQQTAAFFARGNGWLWTVLVLYAVLMGGQAAGIQWPLRPGTAFGRFLQHEAVAASEALLALALLVMSRLSLPPRWAWVVRTAAILAMAVAMGHWLYYYIGSELPLFAGAMRLALQHGRSVRQAAAASR